MGSNLSAEDIENSSDKPRKKVLKINTVVLRKEHKKQDFQQHRSFSPSMRESYNSSKESGHESNQASNKLTSIKKSGDSEQVQNNLISELKMFQGTRKLRTAPVKQRRLNYYSNVEKKNNFQILRDSQQPSHNSANVAPEQFNKEPEAARRDSPSKEKCYDPNDTTLKFVDDEDALDFNYEEFESLRAQMSCGHAVTPTSLTNWCRWQLDEGESNFVCGVQDCDTTWSMEEVCKMALLTPEEIQYFESKIFTNSKYCFDIKSCPGCKSAVVRSDLIDLCVECTVCTAKGKKEFTFCWQCLREWRGPSPRSDRCDNEDCCNQALETLKNCPDMVFNDVMGVVGCPSVRACPRCGFLVEHNKKHCKYVFCTRCKKNFCFVCLELKIYCWKKSNAYEPCSSGVAPRQTYIPVLKS